MIYAGAVSILGLGFLLGLKHALDADHLVAVSTIVSERKGFWLHPSWACCGDWGILLRFWPSGFWSSRFISKFRKKRLWGWSLPPP